MSYVYSRIMKQNYTFRAFMLCAALLSATCNYTLKVKDGTMAYDLKRFNDAIPMLLKDYSKANSRAEKGRIAYRTAECYTLTGRVEASSEWYRKAFDNGYGSPALRGYAYALKQMERYPEAITEFKNLGIEIGSPYEYRKEIAACQIAIEWLKIGPELTTTVAPAAFNSSANDFAPTHAPDGRILFSSDRAMANGKEKYRWTGQKFMDIFIVDASGASPQQFDAVVNSDDNEGTLCFTADAREAYWTRTVPHPETGNRYCAIFMATPDPTGKWSTPVRLAFQKENTNYVHPCITPDGSTLYFSSNDPEGIGGYDLYSIQKKNNDDSGWGEPKLLSRSVNTAANEVFPTLVADTLFFSSNGLPGMGGLDIFKTHKLNKNAWAPPINLKNPINSGSDDFGMLFNKKNSVAPSKPGDLVASGFFTSNRSNEVAKGLDDIYSFEQRVPPPKPPAPDTPLVVAQTNLIIIEGYVLEKIFATPDDPNTKVVGRRPLPAAAVEVNFGEKPVLLNANNDGYFKITAKPNTNYRFTATKADYLSNATQFSTVGIGPDPKKSTQVFEVEIELDKIYRNKEIVLENIYYDYEKWDIRPDAEPALNKLADVLQRNAKVNIQLGSHTDCRGNDNYNQGLSQKRAESAVRYLVGLGVAPERLTALGYGEQSPADGCTCNKCTEAEHQRNRRTTFKIVE